MSMEDEIARSSCATLQIDVLKQLEYDEEDFKLPLMGMTITGEYSLEQTMGTFTERQDNNP